MPSALGGSVGEVGWSPASLQPSPSFFEGGTHEALPVLLGYPFTAHRYLLRLPPEGGGVEALRQAPSPQVGS